MSEIPNKEFVVNKINEWFDSTEFIRNLYSYIKYNKWEEELYKYFSEIYDDLFANLLLKKTFVSNDTKKMLEILATPIYKNDELEKKKIYDKIERI